MQYHDVKSIDEAVARIQTPESYASQFSNKGTEWPYVCEFADGDKQLLYYGCSHSADPEDPMFADIERRVEDMQPDAIVVEGYDGLVSRKDQILQRLRMHTKEACIISDGEPAFALRLAAERACEVYSPEPAFAEELQLLQEKGYSLEELQLWDCTRVAHQFGRHGGRLEEYLSPHIEQFSKAIGNPSVLFTTVAQVEEFGKERIGLHFTLWDVELCGKLVDPIRWEDKDVETWSRLNDISQESNGIRDAAILRNLISYITKHDRVFALYGGTHVVMQEPALRWWFEQQA